MSINPVQITCHSLPIEPVEKQNNSLMQKSWSHFLELSNFQLRKCIDRFFMFVLRIADFVKTCIFPYHQSSVEYNQLQELERFYNFLTPVTRISSKYDESTPTIDISRKKVNQIFNSLSDSIKKDIESNIEKILRNNKQTLTVRDVLEQSSAGFKDRDNLSLLREAVRFSKRKIYQQELFVHPFLEFLLNPLP